MKKLLACLLALMLMLVPFATYAETVTGEAPTEEAQIEEPAEELPPLNYDYDELVVGTTMPTQGNFFTSMWGNGSSDIDVRQLIHGYNLVQWDTEVGGFALDPTVVNGVAATLDAEGNHVYNVSLNEDLSYSDGTPITAWDYAFSFLLSIAPEISDLGGIPMAKDFLEGYSAYMNGDAAYLAGVHVVNDYQLAVTISHEYLPFFFELGLLDCTPYPISVIAPGCAVADDGDGVYLTAPFTAELLKGTILGENGYLSHPTVTSGPYRLVSYDGSTAQFELNENYKGNFHGDRPIIPRIIFKQANPETMVDELMNGDYGLLNKATNATLIQEGIAKTGADPRYGTSNYPRSGLSFLAFNMGHAAMAEETVRKAIALCLDKDGFVADSVSNFGLRVDAYYGLGQWMYQLLSGTLAYPVEELAENATAAERQAYDDEVKAWEELNLEEVKLYDFDPEAAAELLEADGWKLNAEGIREKELNGETVKLDLVLKYAESNSTAGEALQNALAENLEKAGIRLTVEPTGNLLAEYYGQVEREYDLVFLASNFDVIYDPAPMFEPEGAHNYSGSVDEQLYELAVDMRQTEPGDLLSYCQKWVAFEERFAETLPMIPVYSNIYFDFYPLVLHNYLIGQSTTWSQAIVASYMSDIEEEAEEAAEGEEALSEGEVVFDD